MSSAKRLISQTAQGSSRLGQLLVCSDQGGKVLENQLAGAGGP